MAIIYTIQDVKDNQNNEYNSKFNISIHRNYKKLHISSESKFQIIATETTHEIRKENGRILRKT